MRAAAARQAAVVAVVTAVVGGVGHDRSVPVMTTMLPVDHVQNRCAVKRHRGSRYVYRYHLGIYDQLPVLILARLDRAVIVQAQRALQPNANAEEAARADLGLTNKSFVYRQMSMS